MEPTEELNPSLAYIYLKVSTEKEGNFFYHSKFYMTQAAQ
jgi:hypothetical protein